MSGKKSKRGESAKREANDIEKQETNFETKSNNRPVGETEMKAFKQEKNIARENELQDSDEQGDYFVESDLESEFINQGQDFEQWSEGLADEQNLDDADERPMTELEPLHVVSGGIETIELEESDSVIGSLSYVDSEDALIDEQLVGAHVCENEGCHCNVLEGDFCSGACQTADPSLEEVQCICGHNACAATGELGEPGALSATA